MTYTRSIILFSSITALALAISGSAAVADVAATAGQRPDVGCKLLEISDCTLRYRLYTATVETHPLNEIAYLQITDWDTFNRAEKHFREERWESAVRGYERALKELDEIGEEYLVPDKNETGAHLDRRLLVQCRLLTAADRLGRFDQAVAAYVEVVEQMPECFDALQPTHIPGPDSSFIRPARETIDRALQRHQQDRLGVMLAKWANTWRGKHQDPATPERSPQTQPSDSQAQLVKDSRSAQANVSLPPLLRKIVVLIAEEKFDTALDKIDQALPQADTQTLAELYYWQGRAILGTIDHGSLPDVERRRTRAGLAFMRVAIVYPQHERAAECLFRAAEICRNRQQVEPARRLYSELCQGYPDAEPWTPQAAELLKSLSADSDTQPAP